MQPGDLNFTPIDREVKLDASRVMICKFTNERIIEYVNDYFAEIIGLEVHEIVGNNIDSFKHSEVPMTIYNHVMENVLKGQNIRLVLKGQTGDGRFYWYFTDFEFKYDEEGNIVSFLENRRAAPRIILSEIEKLYQKIYLIEKNSGLKIAKNYFEGFNEENQMSFEDYTRSLVVHYENVHSSFMSQQMPQTSPPPQQDQKKSSLFHKVFKK